MCGIAVIYSFRDTAPPVDGGELQRMSAAMRRRGPDGDGLWISADRRIALAHRRLAIIDPSDTGRQPMWSDDGRYAIVFNGEIYNYRSLRAGLEGRGVTFRSQSDTEVLLYLYATAGPAMLGALRGMFAFVLWDGLRRELFAARDPYGIKPLYYSTAGGVFRAASQVRALLAGGGVSPAPCAAGAAGFLLRGCVPEPFTTVEDVRAMPAGHWMTFGPNTAGAPQRYFCLAEELRTAAAATEVRDADAVDIMRQAVTDSVRHHLVADVPVGAFLSAGKDSTAIVALARQLGAPLRAVTIAFDEYRGTPRDEAPVAAAAARALGIDHSVLILTRQEFLRELPSALEAMDQPSVDGLNSYFVSRAAAAAGLKVALSGTGGDELLGGYTTFHRVPGTVHGIGRLSRVPHLGRSLRRVLVALWPDHPRFSPKTPGLVEYGGTYGGAYLIRRGLFMPWELESVIDRDQAREGLGRLDMLGLLSESIRPDPGTNFGRVAALESTWFLRDQLLRDIDWASMSHSLEVRVPLVDVSLLRAVAPLVLRRPRRGKQWLTLCPERPLPEVVLNRPKSGFTLPLNRWLPSYITTRQANRYGMRAWALELYRRWVSADVAGARP